MGSAKAMGKVSIFMVESVCLQLRMMIEDIAVACLIANAEDLPDLARALRREYRPKLILRGLEKLNPDCYPIPLVEKVEGSRGNFRDTYNRPEGDWLTRGEAVEEYGRLSSFVHGNLKSYNDSAVDFLELYQRCGYIEYKIRNLLSHHQIAVLREDTMYRVLMSARGVDEKGIPFEGRIQVVEFTRIPKDMEQAAISGNVNADEIVAARSDANTNTN